LRVLERGPLRALIEREGDYGDGSLLRYAVRLEFFAGQPFLRVFHTFEVHADLPGIWLQQLTVRLPAPKGKQRLLQASLEGGPVWAQEVKESPLWLVQESRDQSRLGKEASRSALSGAFAAAARDARVAIAARHFWQQFPQGVGWVDNHLEYDLFARQSPAVFAGTGAAKTHEFLLFLEAGKGARQRLPDLKVLSLARVDPKWIAASRAMRNAADPTTPETRAFLEKLNRAYERIQRAADREEWEERPTADCPGGESDSKGQRRRGFYGIWNWGDWNFPGYRDSTKGCDAWGNLEYDLPQVLALGYAATGSPPFLDGLIASARHFMDVDIIHAQPRYPQWIGMNHPKNPLHWSFEKGGVDLGHTWTEGLLSYSFLTGDTRGILAARGIGEFLLRRVGAPLLKGNPRQFGWPQIALVALYEATNEDRYRAGALQYARRGMELHAPTKVQDWKLGILAEGLAYVHSLTGDPAIAAWLIQYSRAVLAAGPKSDPRLWPAVAYTLSATPSAPELGDGNALAAVEQVLASLELGNWAKPFTIQSRIGFSLLWYLSQTRTAAGANGMRSLALGDPRGPFVVFPDGPVL
jgi:hypothetical protein